MRRVLAAVGRRWWCSACSSSAGSCSCDVKHVQTFVLPSPSAVVDAFGRDRGALWHNAPDHRLGDAPRLPLRGRHRLRPGDAHGALALPAARPLSGADHDPDDPTHRPGRAARDLAGLRHLAQGHRHGPDRLLSGAREHLPGPDAGRRRPDPAHALDGRIHLGDVLAGAPARCGAAHLRGHEAGRYLQRDRRRVRRVGGSSEGSGCTSSTPTPACRPIGSTLPSSSFRPSASPRSCPCWPSSGCSPHGGAGPPAGAPSFAGGSPDEVPCARRPGGRGRPGPGCRSLRRLGLLLDARPRPERRPRASR